VSVDILNNREWALVIWFFAFIIFTLFSSKMDKIRESFKELLKSFFVKEIFSTFVLMIVYICVVVFVLFEIGLWESGGVSV
jgi:magnesium-transporting ATPase (P-type)